MPLVGGRPEEQNTKRFELQTAPPDGYVVLKRLSYGDKMLRRQHLGKATVHGGDKRTKGGKDFTAEMTLINEQVTLLEFSKSIVDHNLTILLAPGQEVPVDFSNPIHVKRLDGRVGEEIDELITDYNNFEADDETGK